MVSFFISRVALIISVLLSLIFLTWFKYALAVLFLMI
nr:MAG TPA: hypothetical protein [Caudoviricetes sp.]